MIKKLTFLGCMLLSTTIWGQETIQKTDRNNYAYEIVENDPSNTRIYTLSNGIKVYLAQNKDEPRIQTY
ncbi:MAG TPA: hypothetical protein VKY33_03290, partial [Flavobacterium sp.]|nr:hypothetical protein [Flavobacterium sp.]